MKVTAVQATTPPEEHDVELLERLAGARTALEAEIGKRIVGQRAVIEELMTALLSNGHALLVGVPGLAKTLLISTLADALDLAFNRIQFTPDLMPTDITGTEVLEEDRSTGRRAFRFVRGPIFANVVLADEINRTPPKTQAALLQAMQERAVTISGETFILERPFFVLATQNPIEQEGTYPLPEAQLDRFMLELRITYPSASEEERIAQETTSEAEAVVQPVLDAAELLAYQGLVRRVPAPPSLVRYAVRLARATRPHDADAPGLTRTYISWGAGPRASQYLVLAAKARAAMEGRPAPDYDDVRAAAPAVLRHRVVTSFQAEADGRTSVDLVEELIGLSRKWT
ncbi:MAG: AAA family ATPase [Longimicrobiales bacterium]